MSLQNEHEDGTLYRTEESSGTRVRMKVSTLERSEGVKILMVERHRPLYNRQKDSTIIELGRESMRQEICEARGGRATRAAFDSTTTTMDQQKGLLDMLKGRQQVPGLWMTGPHAKLAGKLCMWFLSPDGHMSCGTGGKGEGGLARARVVLHNVPGCSTAFFFFRALSVTHSRASSWSNWCCCRDSGMRMRGGRTGLEWGGWGRGRVGAFEYIPMLLNTSEMMPYEPRIESFSTGWVLRNLTLFRFLVHWLM